MLTAPHTSRRELATSSTSPNTSQKMARPSGMGSSAAASTSPTMGSPLPVMPWYTDQPISIKNTASSTTASRWLTWPS